MIVGVSGIGHLLVSNDFLMPFVKWGGILFLLAYAARAIKSACYKSTLAPDYNKPPQTHTAFVLSLLSISLLNPNVYLDTVLLVGTIGGALPVMQSVVFVLGAIMTSFIWFFALAFGAQKLAPYLRTPIAWRIINSLIAIMMVSARASTL